MNERLQKVAGRILALREITKTSGFITTRSQNAMLSNLSDIELAEVAEMIRTSETKATTNEPAK